MAIYITHEVIEMNTKELIEKAKMDKKWAVVAKRRLAELRSGTVEPVPGQEVFDKIWKRFEE